MIEDFWLIIITIRGMELKYFVWCKYVFLKYGQQFRHNYK